MKTILCWLLGGHKYSRNFYQEIEPFCGSAISDTIEVIVCERCGKYKTQ